MAFTKPSAGSWNKAPAAKPSAAAAAPSASAQPRKKAVKRISFKNEDGTWLNINLFQNVSKAGKEYLGGTDRETKTRFSFFENKDGGLLLVGDEKVELKKYQNEDGSVVFSGKGWKVADPYKSPVA